MSCIYKIKENMQDFTETEKKLGVYIIENKDKVINFSSQKLAEEVGTSAAAVVRFSKRLGYKGFTHLKVEIAKDTNIEDEDSLEKFVTEHDSIETMIRKAHYGNHRTFDNTYKLLQANILEESIAALNAARRIYLVGIGGSYLVVQDLSSKLVRIDKQAVFFDDFHLLVSSLSHITKEDVLVAFSYSGETKEVNVAQRMAKEKGVTTIAVTQAGRNELAKHSDLVISIPKEESELRLGSISSRFSMLVVSDLLYLGVAKENIEDTRSKLIDSRKNIRGLAGSGR